MRKKNWLSILSLVILSVLLICASGCSKEEKAAEVDVPSHEQPNSDLAVDDRYKPYQGVTLTMIRHSGYEADWMQEIAEQFYDETGIKVNIEQVAYSELKNKVIIDISSSSGSYDLIATTEYWLPEFNAGGWLVDMKPFINNPQLYDPAFEIDDVSSSLLEANSMNGQLLAMPWKFNSQFLFYRTDLIETPPANWEEMLNYAKTLTDGSLYGVSLALGKSSIMDVYLNTLYQNGGQLLSDDTKTCLLDSDEALGALEYLIELSKFTSDGSINNHWDESAANFAQGNAAMFPGVNSQLDNIVNPERSMVYNKVGYAEWPGNLHSAAVSSTWGLAITKNCDNPEAAYLFIQYMLNAERTEDLVEKTSGAAVPVRTSLLLSEELNKTYPHFRVMNDISTLTGHTFVYPKTSQTTAIMDILAGYIQEAVIGTKAPNDALLAAKADIEKLL